MIGLTMKALPYKQSISTELTNTMLLLPTMSHVKTTVIKKKKLITQTCVSCYLSPCCFILQILNSTLL